MLRWLALLVSRSSRVSSTWGNDESKFGKLISPVGWLCLLCVVREAVVRIDTPRPHEHKRLALSRLSANTPPVSPESTKVWDLQ